MRANLPEDAPPKPTDGPLLSEPSGRGSLDWFHDNTSHSGHEKNHLFVNNMGSGKGELFTDISGISGVDSSADARASVIWDFDRDGFSDLATVNANAPKLELWHNRYPELAHDALEAGRFIALRFIGGNHTANPSRNASPRDGYGARVIATLGEDPESLSLRREHRAGEGFASQNSATLRIGLGRHEKMSRLSVRWPSGRVTQLSDIPAGSLVTAFELAEPAFQIAPYSIRSVDDGVARLNLTTEERAKLVMYTTMTTTCPNCRAELPELEHLRASFPTDDLAMFAIPVDPLDTPAMLAQWESRFEPPYRVLRNLSGQERETTRALVLSELRIEATPTTIVTTRDGSVLSIQLGAPTVSELRRLMSAE